MERIKEYLWKVKNSPVVFQEDCEAEVNEVNKEITTYLIGEVEELKKEDERYFLLEGEEELRKEVFGQTRAEITNDLVEKRSGYNQALDEVEKMLKEEK